MLASVFRRTRSCCKRPSTCAAAWADRSLPRPRHGSFSDSRGGSSDRLFDHRRRLAHHRGTRHLDGPDVRQVPRSGAPGAAGGRPRRVVHRRSGRLPGGSDRAGRMAGARAGHAAHLRGPPPRRLRCRGSPGPSGRGGHLGPAALSERRRVRRATLPPPEGPGADVRVCAGLQRLAARVGVGRSSPADPGGVAALLGRRRLRSRSGTLRRARLQGRTLHRRTSPFRPPVSGGAVLGPTVGDGVIPRDAGQPARWGRRVQLGHQAHEHPRVSPSPSPSRV